MHLFLTSSPCTVRAPEGVPLPFLYNEANGFVQRLRERVRPGCEGVMVAAWPEDHARNDEMAEAFAGALRWQGMGLSRMTMLDSRNGEEAAALIAGSGLVLLSGGHVPTQNRFFSDIGLRECLQGYEGTVIGISAGSMNAAETVYVQPEEAGESLDPDFRRFVPGLGLTGLQILPHYNQVRDNWLDGRRLIEDITFGDSYGHSFVVLSDGSYILQEDGRAELFGESWEITDGEMRPLCGEGESSVLFAL